jgi:hypothetical protein
VQPFAPYESLPLACGVTIACAVGITAIFGRSRARRTVAWALVGCAFAAAFLAPPDPPFLRFLLALFAFLFLFRVIELGRDRRDHSFRARLWFLTSPFDTRKAVSTETRIDAGLVAGAVLWPAVTGAAFSAIALYAPFSLVPTELALRWSLGLVGSYAMAEAAHHLVKLGYAAGGIGIPVLHRAPILSLTVAEFWGERWNLEVNRILREQVFVPIARRRRPTTAIAAAFGVSVVLHVWIMVPPGGWLLAGLWALYFGGHGLLVILERTLGVRRWRSAIQRAWTIGLFVATGPLFVEPFLRITVG